MVGVSGYRLIGAMRFAYYPIGAMRFAYCTLHLLSHGDLVDLTGVLESVSKQAVRWQQWFDNGAVG